MRALLVCLSALITALAAPSAHDVKAQDARGRFVEICRDEVLAANLGAAGWVGEECDERWVKVARSNPMADAVLSLFRLTDRPALTRADIVSRARMVTWPTSPGVADRFEGRFAGLGVLAQDAPPRMVVGWSVTGAPVPYDIVGALRARGADIDTIGCYTFGASESTNVLYVEAPGHAPFALTVYSREAPTASAQSSYSVSAAADRVIPTLDDLRRAEPFEEWQARCD